MYLTKQEIKDLIKACEIEHFNYATSWQTNDIVEDNECYNEHKRIQTLKERLKNELKDREDREPIRQYILCKDEKREEVAKDFFKRGFELRSIERYKKLGKTYNRLLFVIDWR